MGEETEANSDAETYRCESCGRSFDSEAALHRHVHDVGLVD